MQNTLLCFMVAAPTWCVFSPHGWYPLDVKFSVCCLQTLGFSVSSSVSSALQTVLPQVFLLLFHHNKSPFRSSALKLSLWPRNTRQADLVLVWHSFPICKRSPFVFVCLWIVYNKWIPWPKKIAVKSNWNNDQKAIIMPPGACHHETICKHK